MSKNYTVQCQLTERVFDMIYGYARTSTAGQNTDRQVQQLLAAGVDQKNLFIDAGISGTVKPHNREAFTSLMDKVEEGDTVYIVDFDRLSRSLIALLTSVTEDFQEKGINLVSLNQALDTRTPAGMLQLQILSALAEFERKQIKERCDEGRQAARAAGRSLGGQPKLSQTKSKNIDQALELYANSKLSVSEIAKMCGVSRQSIYNYAKERGISRN